MKRIISFVLCLSMLLSMVPVTVFAAEVEETTAVTETVPVEESTAPTEALEESVPETTEAPETTAPAVTEAAVLEATQPAQQEEVIPEETEEVITIETFTWVPDVELPSDEELFAGYVEQQFYGTGASTFGTAGRELLDEPHQLIYDALAVEIKKIAAGEQASAVIPVGSYLGDQTFTNEDGSTVTYPCTPETETDLSTLDNLDIQTLLDVLLADFPYELYWFDKTWGVSAIYISAANEGCYIFYFTVSSDYSLTEEECTYDVNTGLTGATSTAVEKALSIVDQYQSESDYNKLLGYKNAICSLTDYNTSAASNSSTPYGDPWQLIWVFDGDSRTKVVCEGYAKAFQYLCDRSDFDNDILCYSVVGYLNPKSTNHGAHMWNVLRVNDTSSYLVDVTNCDTGFALFLRGGDISKGAYYYEYNASTDTVSFVLDESVNGTYTFDGQKFVYDRDQTLALWGSEVLTLATEDLEDLPEVPEETEPTEPETEPTEPTEPEETTAMTGDELVALLASQTGNMYTLYEAVVIDSAIELPEIDLFVWGNGSITVKANGSLTFTNNLEFANGGSLTVEAGSSLTANGALCAAGGGTIDVKGSYLLGEASHVVLNYPGSISGIETSSINFFAPVWDEASLLDSLNYQGYASSEIIITGSDLDQDGKPDPVVLTQDLTIPEGWSFVIGDEMGIAASLQLADGVTLINNGTMSIWHGASLILGDDAVLNGSGQILSDGSIVSYGTIECTVGGSGTVSEYMSQAQFLTLLNSSEEFTVSRPLTLTGNVIIPDGKQIYFEESGSLTVADGAKLTVEGSLTFPGTSLTVQSGGSLILTGQGYLGFYGVSALTIEEGASYEVLGEAEIYANQGTILTGITKGEVVNSNFIENPEDDLQEVAEMLGAGYKKFYLTLYTDYVVSEDITLPANVVLQQFGNTLTITDGATLTVNGDWELGIEVIVYAAEQVGGHIVIEDGTLVTNGALELKHGSTMTLGRNASYTVNGSFSVDAGSSVTNNGTVTVNGSMSQNGSWSGNSAKDLNNAPETQTELEAQLKAAKGSVFLTVPLTLTKDLTVPEGVTLVLTGDGSITIPAQRTLINNGSILLQNPTEDTCGIVNTTGGTLLNNGTIRNEGSLDLSEGIYQSSEDAELILAYLNQGEGTGILSELLCGENEDLYKQVTMVVEGWHEAQMRYVMDLAAEKQPKALLINICGDMALNTAWYGTTLDLPEYATLSLADLGYGPASLTLPKGYTLTNNGSIEIGSAGTLIVKSGAVLKGKLPVCLDDGQYVNENTKTLTGKLANTKLTGPAIVTGTLEIPSNVTLTVSGDGASLVLAEGAELINNGTIVVEKDGILDASKGTYTNNGGTVTHTFICDENGNITRATVLGIQPNDMKFFAQTYSDDAVIREMIEYVSALVENGTLTNHESRDFFPIDFAGNTVLSADLELPSYSLSGISGSLTIPEGITLTDHCGMVVNGLLTVNGKVIATGYPTIVEGEECIINPEKCTNCYIMGVLPESITVIPSAAAVHVGEEIELRIADWSPAYAEYFGDVMLEISGDIQEFVTCTQDPMTKHITASSNVPGTVILTITALGQDGIPLMKDEQTISEEIELRFLENRIYIFREDTPDFYENGFVGLYSGSSLRYYANLTGVEGEIDQSIQWEYPSTQDIASYSVKDGVLTVSASNSLFQLKILEITATHSENNAVTCSEMLYLRPKASSVDVTLNGTIVTGQTVQFDVNREDTAQLAPMATPEDAYSAHLTSAGKTLVQWKSSNEDIAVVDQDGTVTFTGEKTGKVKITMTTNFGSKKTASMTFNAVKLAQSIESSETNAAQLIGGSSATYTVYDISDPNRKALKSSAVKWFLCDKDGDPIDSHPYASITAAGKLTTKTVADEINVYLMAQVVGNEDIAHLSEPVLVELYPAVSSAQILVGTTPISGTLLYDTSVLGDQYPLSWSAGPYLESVKDVSWKSSASKVATIDDNGLIEVLKPGTAKFTLTVTALNNKKTTATVTMKFGIFTRGLDLSARLPGEKEATDALDYLTIYSGQSITFYAENAPANVTTSGVKWSADSKNYATMSSTGTLKAKTVTQPVIVTVLAESKDGSPEGIYSIDVLVLPKQTSDGMDAMVLYTGDTEDGYSFLTKTTRSIAPKETLQVYASDYVDWNDDAADSFEIIAAEDVEWVSSKTSVATVDANGLVTAVGSGTAKITATDGFDRTAYFTVKVSKTSVDVEIAQKKTGATRNLSVASGKSLDLVGTVTYTDDSTDAKVNWSVSDTSLAAISSSGKLTAAKNLTKPAVVTVWAYAKDGSPMAFDSINVTILPLTTGVEIFGTFGGSYKDVSNTTQKWDLTTQADTLTLSAKVFPEGAMGVTWKSSNKNIVKIDENSGEVTCLKPGTVTITATAADGSNKKVSFKLTVHRTMRKDTLVLPETAIIGGGKSLTMTKLEDYAIDDAATDQTLAWTLTYPNGTAVPKSVASISSKGVLSTKKVTAPLTLCIKATSTDGSLCTASCFVTIYPVTTKVSITNAPATIPVNSTVTLTAQATPVTGADTFTWKSSNAAIASVDENTGVVTAHKPGTVSITATAKDGSNKNASVKIKVVPVTFTVHVKTLSGNNQVTRTFTSSTPYLLDALLDEGFVEGEYETYSDGTSIHTAFRTISVNGISSKESSIRFQWWCCINGEEYADINMLKIVPGGYYEFRPYQD